MADKNLINPNEFWDRLNKASYDVITYPDREMDSPQFGYYTDTIQAVLNQTKKVDAVEVVHGRNLDADTPSLFECSVCHWCCSDTYYGDTADYNYCPNCGAKMDGGNEK